MEEEAEEEWREESGEKTYNLPDRLRANTLDWPGTNVFRSYVCFLFSLGPTLCIARCKTYLAHQPLSNPTRWVISFPP